MSTSDDEEDKVKEVISVAQPVGKPVYAILTAYEPMDAINAVGQVVQFTEHSDGEISCDGILNTNDGLCFIWCSPQNNLWVGSSDGRVWTTADVKWDPSKIEGIEVTQSDPNFKWKGMDVLCEPKGESHMIATLWGSSDQDMHVGTFEGAILHWNGKKWSYGQRQNEQPLQDMHGTGPKNVWAVGRNGTVLHFDGNRWSKVPLPGDAEKGENLTGVWALSDDEVHVCSQSGAIFYGIVEFKEAMYLAAGDDGVCSLKGNKLKRVRKTFGTAGIFRLPTRLAFVEPDQSEEAGVVIHDPESGDPWLGWTA